MGQITTDQSHSVMATLALNTEWSEIDFEGSNLQELVIRNPKEAGRQFTAFLRNGGRVIVGKPKIIIINRNRFNPKKFIGDGWSILNNETNARSIALTELDLTKVQFVTMLKDGESYIKGEENLKRLKESDYIRLDADIFLTLWENKALIPESWKEKVNGNTCYIFFDGTVLRGLSGSRYVLYLYWDGGEWRWDVGWLGSDWNVNDPSAVLAS